MRLHIIGVSVSEIIAETTTAMVSVSANSRNIRPTRPVMNRSGMNTAISDSVSDITVKPISRAPSSAASNGFSPSSMWRTMFSIITMASSTTKPVPIVSAISDRLSRLKPQNHMTPKVAISESGSPSSDDVFDHHDGVVDHEAGSDRQRHQRQIVEAEAAKPHDPEGRDQRKRQR